MTISYHKYLSKPAKTLLAILRDKYHESARRESAFIPFPDLEQKLGIDSDAVMSFANELRKYLLVQRDHHLERTTELIWKLTITDKGLAEAEQLRTWYRIKRLLKPTVVFAAGIVATLIAQLLYKAWFER